MASYFAYELISVFPPHVSVGSDIHSPRLKRSQQSGVWWNKESCSFSMSQQAAHKLCTQTQRCSQNLQFVCSICLLFKSVYTNPRALFLLFSWLETSEVASLCMWICEFKMQPVSHLQYSKVILWSIIHVSEWAALPFLRRAVWHWGMADEVLHLYGERSRDSSLICYR